MNFIYITAVIIINKKLKWKRMDIATILIGYVSYLIFILEILAIIDILSKRKKPASMIGWILAIVFVPAIGVFLYFIFGNRKLKKYIENTKPLLFSQKSQSVYHNDIEKILIKRDISPSTKNNHCYICKDSIDAYKKIIDLIKNAKKEIYITTYVYKMDYTGKKILNLLEKKAKEGVEIKILIDSIGSLYLHFFPFYFKRLKTAGGKVAFFMPIISLKPSLALNLRNHRKMIIVDGEKVFTGGMNIAQEYFGPKKVKKRWIDLGVIIEGEAVNLYKEVFLHDWNITTGEKIDFIPTAKKISNCNIQVVPSGPDIKSDAFYEALLSSIFLAKKRFWIITPYFIPDDSITEALILANHRGVDIKILTPLKSNHPSADFGRIGYLRDLQEEGVKIYLYKKRMMHQKIIVIDDEIAVFGSANIDVRSLFYNFEIMNFVYSKEICKTITNMVEKYFKDCQIGVKKANKIIRTVENVGKIISPIL